MSKKHKPTPWQESVKLLERNALYAYDPALATDRSGQQDLDKVQRVKDVVLTRESPYAPTDRSDKIARSIVTLSLNPSNIEYPIGIKVENAHAGGTAERFHIAFGRDHSAIVTEIGSEGESLRPAEDAQSVIDSTSYILDRITRERAA